MGKDSVLRALIEVREQLKELEEYLPFMVDCERVKKIDLKVFEVIQEIRKKEKQKFKSEDVTTMVWEYQLCEFSIKNTLKKLEKKGIHISDKQLRNILQKEGYYRGKEKKKS